MCTIPQKLGRASPSFSFQKSAQNEQIRDRAAEIGIPLAEVPGRPLHSGIMQGKAEEPDPSRPISTQIDRTTGLSQSSSEATSLVPAKTRGFQQPTYKKAVQYLEQTSHSEGPFSTHCPQMNQRAEFWRSGDSSIAGGPSGEITQLELPNGIQAVVAAIIPAERAQLIQFARRRLDHFGMNAGEADDLYQQAICAVLNGGAKKRGRKPNAADLATRGAFQNYLRGVINSVAEGWARKHHRVTKRTYPLHPMESVLPSSPGTWARIEFTDLQAQLFGRLRQLAPARLLPTIEAWQRAPDERIPCVTGRKHVCSVRRLAQQIAPKLGLERRPARRPLPARH